MYRSRKKVFYTALYSVILTLVLLILASPALGSPEMSAASYTATSVKPTKDGWYLHLAKTEVDQHNQYTCYVAAMVNVWNAEHPRRQISQKEFWSIQAAAEARNGAMLEGDEYQLPSWNEMYKRGYRFQDVEFTRDWRQAVNFAVTKPVYVEIVMDRAGSWYNPVYTGNGKIPRWTPSKTDVNAELGNGRYFQNAGQRYPHAIMVSGVNPSKRLVRLTNSWGQDWGYGGDAIVSYSDFAKTFTSGNIYYW